MVERGDKRHGRSGFQGNARDSRVSCFGRAVLPVPVGLADLAVPPALAAHKHQLQVRRAETSLRVR